ncbi:DUF1156 domain-containing protein [Pleionea sp. CnH1-48]|uniref:DUF1156 domain-containing protein n=1 Tax=Pleionea sp. CnH1-48 TaxID=2954494 RepID=UPI002097B644|nr:DUF1156 domain-containing protein [Pleionea sp. CnH1-48]MCO7227389.1 DUF1156 domain-containing protein [Pleionea sp. CnH1-48]
MSKIKSPKKLIEVALPLDDINLASGREKSIRHGHPSTMHLWWARRPLAAARAVIFAQMVNDPGYQDRDGFKYGVNKQEAEKKREELFNIIRDLVKWENTTNIEVLNRAKHAIKESWEDICRLNKNHPKAKELFDPANVPDFHDPFAGGGALPLEAQRLGLNSNATDLNPIPIMINKAMIEVPPLFESKEPIGPIPDSEKQGNLVESWKGATGLAEDVRRYGIYLQVEAKKRIGNLYPDIKVTEELAKHYPTLRDSIGSNLEVILWVWARTVKSPNPAYSGQEVPLTTTFVLSKKAGKEAYIEPVLNENSYEFYVHNSKPTPESKNGTKLGRGANFKCLLSGSPIDPKYIKSEASAGRMGYKLMAVGVNGPKGRMYISPTAEMEMLAKSAKPTWRPEVEISGSSQYLGIKPYGMDRFDQLFTERQLLALTTFSDLISEIKEKVYADAIANGFESDSTSLEDLGKGAKAYSEAISIYLTFAVDYAANYWSTLATPADGFIRGTYSMQALPMSWDFAEAPPFGSTSGNWLSAINWIVKSLQLLPANTKGLVTQQNAATQSVSENKVISTDPPYYDNVPYADLSDYFYVWMRRSLRSVYPNLFSTLTTPKVDELVAFAHRHNKNKDAAETFFLSGMTEAMGRLVELANDSYPVTIYYAFKQGETSEIGTGNTGWETFLHAVIKSGFLITGTWPMRTERGARNRSIGSNALASSIVLVCKKRDVNAQTITRREFQRELRAEMPESLDAMVGGTGGTSPIAPVDLAQAAIGPGMAIYSKYKSVINQDGSEMSVHDALVMVNKAITEYLNPNSGNFDNDTLFCDDWFSQYGWGQGQFGEADTLARAKGTSVDGVRDAGVIESGGGKVRLLKWSEYPTDWDPKTDTRTPVWEACHQMIRVLNQQGEAETGALLARMPERGEHIRQLAYHLYTLCERKKWAEEARAYNELIGSWHAIVAASHEVGHRGTQSELGLDF